VVLLAGYKAIVGRRLIAEYGPNLVNIHPSLLPRHGGRFDLHAHQSVLGTGDTHTGCTFHQVTAKVDQGPITLQRRIRVPEGVTAEELRALVQEEEGEGLVDLLTLLAGSGCGAAGGAGAAEGGDGSTQYSVDGKAAAAVAIHAARCDPAIGGFCGVWVDRADQLWGACTDGVGTKLILAVQEYRHTGSQSYLDNIAQDLVAMSVNDLMVAGGVPEVFLDYIAVDRADPKLCQGIIDGVRKACGLCRCRLVGGETAEMRGVYLPGGCDLAGFAVGPIARSLPEPDRMEPGQPVYALRSSGPHSNGFTLIHSLLQKGVELNHAALLAPTKVYSNLPDLLHHPGALGAAHITGGGVHANMERVLPKNLRLELDRGAWRWPPVFRDIQRASGLSEDGMLEVFNCGLGVLIVYESDRDAAWAESNGLVLVGRLVERGLAPAGVVSESC
jgi:phosphoribosylaminoimidazole synthetase